MIDHLFNVWTMREYFTRFQYDVSSDCPDVDHLNVLNCEELTMGGGG